jgi:hypothetical protein
MPDIRGTEDVTEDARRLEEERLKKLVDMGEFRFMENIIIPIDYVQALLLVKLAKEKQYDVIKEIFATRDNTIARMVKALAEGGGCNLISAWVNGHIIAQLLEHNYMIRKGGAVSIVQGANWLAGTAATAELVGAFSVPATLIFGGGGSSAGALAKILGGGK